MNVAYQVKLSEPKTARDRRTISLDPATAAVLRRHRDLQAEETVAALELLRTTTGLRPAATAASPPGPPTNTPARKNGRGPTQPSLPGLD